jgi:DNA topoisomerase-1
MRDRHVDVNGSTIEFNFKGKSGKWHKVGIRDRRLAKVVKSCQDLPGQELFQYLDEEGNRQDVNSTDVNDYLRKISGQDFTAKDFRTWAGTVLGAMALREFERFDSKTQAKKNIVQAIENVAMRLGNTPAVCRKSYVHPDIIDSYLDGTLVRTLKRRAEEQLATSLKSLSPEEGAILGLLQQRLAKEEKKNRDLTPVLRASIAKVRNRSKR